MDQNQVLEITFQDNQDPNYDSDWWNHDDVFLHRPSTKSELELEREIELELEYEPEPEPEPEIDPTPTPTPQTESLSFSKGVVLPVFLFLFLSGLLFAVLYVVEPTFLTEKDVTTGEPELDMVKFATLYIPLEVVTAIVLYMVWPKKKSPVINYT
jgi:hypothetical protein